MRYPASLPLMSGKARKRPASFASTDPAKAFMHTRQRGTDHPVTWDFSLTMQPADASLFQLWFRDELMGGALEFTMPIRTEFGLVEHLVRFDGVPTCTEIGPLFRYACAVSARQEIIPAGYVAMAQFIIRDPEWATAAGRLDAIMAGWPA